MLLLLFLLCHHYLPLGHHRILPLYHVSLASPHRHRHRRRRRRQHHRGYSNSSGSLDAFFSHCPPSCNVISPTVHAPCFNTRYHRFVPPTSTHTHSHIETGRDEAHSPDRCDVLCLLARCSPPPHYRHPPIQCSLENGLCRAAFGLCVSLCISLCVVIIGLVRSHDRSAELVLVHQPLLPC